MKNFEKENLIGPHRFSDAVKKILSHRICEVIRLHFQLLIRVICNAAIEN